MNAMLFVDAIVFVAAADDAPDIDAIVIGANIHRQGLVLTWL